MFPSAPGRSGILVKPGARDVRSLSAPGSGQISLGDVFNESVVHVASPAVTPSAVSGRGQLRAL